MDDLLKYSAGGLKDLKRQVESQRKEISVIQASNTQIAATMTHLASGYDGDVLRGVDALAACPKGPEDTFLEHVYAEIGAAHDKLEIERRRRAAMAAAAASAAAEVTTTTTSTAEGARENGELCLSTGAVTVSLEHKMLLRKAGYTTNFASRDLGGSIVFSDMLTSPSFSPPPSTSSINRTIDDGGDSAGGAGGAGGGGHVAETMRHVLGLRSIFPPPESVIERKGSPSTPKLVPKKGSGSSGGSDRQRKHSADGSRISKHSGHAIPCWAFGGDTGRITVQLSRPVAVTHVSLEQRDPRAAALREEVLAAPRSFKVWGLDSIVNSRPATLLGDFQYRNDKRQLAPKQTFAVTNTSGSQTWSFITLDITSNHGHAE
jgi:hypothetical protein